MPLPSSALLPGTSILPGSGVLPSGGRATAYGPTLVQAKNGDGVYVEVSWTDGGGIFTIGSSTLGGVDELAGIFPLENWTDITSDVQAVTISRGRQDATSAIQQATCTVSLFDDAGKYNAANPSSPLYGLLAPSRPMRVRVQYESVNYVLWEGVTSETVAAESAHNPYASLAGVDLLERLAQEEPVIPTVDSTTTGAAIGMVLDAVGWWGNRRRITTGDPIVNFSADGSQKAMDVINQLLDHEGGIFYMSADGYATYLPYQGNQTVKATVTQTNMISPGVSISTIYNRARVTASQGAEQAYLDGVSISKHGPRDVPNTPLSAQWLPDEASAAVLAERLVTVYETQPVWQLTLQKGDLSNAATKSVYLNMISLDVGDRITLNDAASGSQGDYSIEGITHTIQAGSLDHETSWVLRMRPFNVFTIGQSVLSGTDTLGA